MNASSVTNLHPVGDDYVGGEDGSIALDPSNAFVSSHEVQDITDRAMAYLEAGYPVHFSGPPGTGKTTLAFHVAAQIGQPTILLHGDHEFGSSDLIGRESGYSKSRVVDNYIGSVLKFQEEGRALWIDNRITTACRLGHTIIYDEFNRSKPEANNPFLSILSEGVLNVPGLHGRGEGYVNVHPNFRAIFTSNPTEYAGVYKTQDTLLDRMVTLHLSHYDRETEIAIAANKSGIDPDRAARIVDLVRLCRCEGQDPHYPTLRASIAIARVLSSRGGDASIHNPVFVWACRDILSQTSSRASNDGAVSPAFISLLMRRLENDDADAAARGNGHAGRHASSLSRGGT